MYAALLWTSKFPKNLLTTSGLSILLYGVISLPDATSYDKKFYTLYWKQLRSRSAGF